MQGITWVCAGGAGTMMGVGKSGACAWATHSRTRRWPPGGVTPEPPGVFPLENPAQQPEVTAVNYQSKNIRLWRAFVASMLNAVKVVPGAALIVGGKIRLSKSESFNPLGTEAVADFEADEADYTGYAAGGIAATFSVPVNQNASTLAIVAPALFVAGTATPQVACTVYGWWLDDGTNVVMAERFANNLNKAFAAPGDFLALDVPLSASLNLTL